MPETNTFKRSSRIESILAEVPLVRLDLDLQVKPVTVPVAKMPPRRNRAIFDLWDSCFSDGESEIHSVMKWSVACGLIGDWDEMEVYYETHGSPFERSLWVPNYFDEENAPTKTIYKVSDSGGEKEPWFCERRTEKVLRPDVFFAKNPSKAETVVECGVTNAKSLVAPIYGKVARNSIWLPFPFKEISLGWHPSIEFFIGFKILRKQPKHLRKRVQSL